MYRTSHIVIADIEVFSGNIFHFTATKDAKVDLVSAKRIVRASNDILDTSIPYRGCICDLSQISYLHKDARIYLASGEDVAGKIVAVAIIANSAIGKSIANLFISFCNPLVFPAKFFDSPIRAEHWVKGKMNAALKEAVQEANSIKQIV